MQPFQIVSVVLVIKCKNKFLLVQRHKNDEVFPGKWQNVGGKIEIGETVETAIKREVKEEVSIKVDSQPVFLQSYSWKKKKRSLSRLGLVFLIKLDGKLGDYSVNPNEELADYGWFSLEEAKKMNEKNMLIGKNSPTGTFSQLLKATKIA